MDWPWRMLCLSGLRERKSCSWAVATVCVAGGGHTLSMSDASRPDIDSVCHTCQETRLLVRHFKQQFSNLSSPSSLDDDEEDDEEPASRRFTFLSARMSGEACLCAAHGRAFFAFERGALTLTERCARVCAVVP